MKLRDELLIKILYHFNFSQREIRDLLKTNMNIISQVLKDERKGTADNTKLLEIYQLLNKNQE